MKVFRFSLALSACLFLIAPVVFGQTTGEIQGTVSGTDGRPLPGVTVEASSPSLQGSRTSVTGNDGTFRFIALPPGTYKVRGNLSGFTTVEKVASVRLDAAVTVQLQLQVSAKEELVVTGEAPVVDSTTAESGTNIRREVAQKLPLGRNYSSVVAIQPGVNIDLAETQGRGGSSNPTGGGFTIYGSTSVENAYLVDGVNTTNVIKGFQGKALSQEFIEEVQVKASGYEAEYGRAMGGVINVVTKSGGNDFHGDAFGYFNLKSLTADFKGTSNLVDDPNNPDNQINLGTDAGVTVDRTQQNRQDYGADLGGYMMKDHIWFFGAYNRVTYNQSQVPITGGGYATSGEDLPFDSTANIYSGKMTFRLGEGTTLVGTVFGDPETRTGNLANLTSSNPIIRQAVRNIGATDYSGSISQLFGSSAILTARYAHHADRYELNGTPENNDYRIIDYTTNSNGVSSHGFGIIFGATNFNASKRDSYMANGTFYAANHEIKVGGDYENNLTNTLTFYTGSAQLRIRPCPTSGDRLCPTGDTIYYQHDFITNDNIDPAAGFLPQGNVANPKTRRYGAYIQDKWTVMPGLTASLGVRWDNELLKTSLGEKAFDLKNEWQPRIGVAWDIVGDGSSKLAASYGIFYFAVPADINVRAYGGQLTASTYNFSSDPLDVSQDPGAPRDPGIQGGINIEPAQQGIKGIYQSEYTLSFDKAIDPTFAVGVKGTFRYLGRTIEDRCDLDSSYPEANNNTCAVINPGSNDRFSTGDFHGCLGPDYLVYTNPPGDPCTGPVTTPISQPLPPGGIYTSSVPKARRQYLGIELVAKKQIGRSVWAQASYIWSQLKGNYDGLSRQANGGQTDPGINADYDYAAFLHNAYGLLYLDRPHAGRLDVAYTTPFGLTAGFSGYVRTGTPQNTIGYFNSIYGSELFLIQRGHGGCPALPSVVTVNTDPTASCAKDRLPTDYEISASLGYTIKIAPVDISLFLQGFNLLNRQTAIDNLQDFTQNPPGDSQERQPDYHKITTRTAPRALRFGARISF
jgi:hypothetical protein